MGDVISWKDFTRGSWPRAQALVSHVEVPSAEQAGPRDGHAQFLGGQVRSSSVECAEWVHWALAGIRSCS